eukprot:6186068-Pleurochrysis_carterae.AAC.4
MSVAKVWRSSGEGRSLDELRAASLRTLTESRHGADGALARVHPVQQAHRRLQQFARGAAQGAEGPRGHVGRARGDGGRPLRQPGEPALRPRQMEN